jgi:hypothetical protein
MTTYLVQFHSGVKKLINLRSVTSVTLHKNTVSIFYSFSKPDEVYDINCSIEKYQAYDAMVWPTETRAVAEFEKIQKCMEELK